MATIPTYKAAGHIDVLGHPGVDDTIKNQSSYIFGDEEYDYLSPCAPSALDDIGLLPLLDTQHLRVPSAASPFTSPSPYSSTASRSPSPYDTSGEPHTYFPFAYGVHEFNFGVDLVRYGQFHPDTSMPGPSHLEGGPFYGLDR